ncbi:hypothetical protein BO79DRAFT_289089, partial [Aspergillus costaricaensis CBS 115574]
MEESHGRCALALAPLFGICLWRITATTTWTTAAGSSPHRNQPPCNSPRLGLPTRASAPPAPRSSGRISVKLFI